MNYDLMTALALLCFVTTITPGPNNFVVLASTVRGGVRRALPSYLGICIGFPFMVFAVSYAAVFVGEDIFQKVAFLKYVGAAFLLYLSVKIFLSKSASNDLETHSDIGFVQMFTFQWLNPKAWGMVLSALSLVGPSYYLWPAIGFLIAAFPCVGVWLLAGNFIRARILSTPLENYLNKVFGVLLASSVVLIL